MKTKRIISIAIVSIIFALCVGVIVSACVPKNLNFGFTEPQSITIYKEGAINGNTYQKGSDEYNKIMDLYKKSFKTSCLSAFFQGKGFNKITTIDSTKSVSSMKTGSNGISIEFTFAEDQNVDYHGADLKLDASEKTFRSVVIEVKNTSKLSQVNAYLLNVNNTDVSYVSYVSYASQVNLYEYLTNF